MGLHHKQIWFIANQHPVQNNKFNIINNSTRTKNNK